MHPTTARIAQILVTPGPFLRWLAKHPADAAVGINASVENNMIAFFLREELRLAKRSIKVYAHKIEVLVGPGRCPELVIPPAWCAAILAALARSFRPLTILSAGDMHKTMAIVERYWADRVKRHYWGGLRNPEGYVE